MPDRALPPAWHEALDELLATSADGPWSARLFRALFRLDGVRAAALWARVDEEATAGGPGQRPRWIQVRRHGPEDGLPGESAVEACTGEGLSFDLPSNQRLLRLPDGRHALALALDADGDPDLVDALVLAGLLGGEGPSATPDPLDALEALGLTGGPDPDGDGSSFGGLFDSRSRPDSPPRSRPPGRDAGASRNTPGEGGD